MSKRGPFGVKINPAVKSFVGHAIKQAWQGSAEARIKLSYDGGRSSRARISAPPLRGPDSPLHQFQGIDMVRRAQDLKRNDGFFWAIIDMFQTYVLGDLHYIPNVGTRAENQAYRDFFDRWMTQSDKMNRFHYVQQLKFALGGQMVNGKHGHADFHDENGGYQIQDVSGDCIGNPRELRISENYVQGVILDENKMPIAVRIFRRTINDQYLFERDIDLAVFTLFNPVDSPDEIVAKSAFHAVLNSSQDMHEIEEAWKMKIKRAGYITTIQNVPNGGFPPGDEGLGFGRGGDDGMLAGRVNNFLPGEDMIGEPGFEVKMLENPTPTMNELEATQNVLGKIAAGVGVPLPFMWAMMTGVQGTLARLYSKKAERTFQDGPYGQKSMQRAGMVKQKNNALLSGILRGEIPWTKNWDRGSFMFPAHPSVDEGNDSDSDLNEMRQGVKSQAEFNAKNGRFWQDVDAEIRAEAKNKIEMAIEMAAELNAENPGLALTWQDAMPYIQAMSANPKAPEKPKSDPATATP